MPVFYQADIQNSCYMSGISDKIKPGQELAVGKCLTLYRDI